MLIVIWTRTVCRRTNTLLKEKRASSKTDESNSNNPPKDGEIVTFVIATGRPIFISIQRRFAQRFTV